MNTINNVLAWAVGVVVSVLIIGAAIVLTTIVLIGA